MHPEILTHLYTTNPFAETLDRAETRLVDILTERGGLLDRQGGHLYHLSQLERGKETVTVSAAIDPEEQALRLTINIGSGLQQAFLHIRPFAQRVQWTLASTSTNGSIPSPIEAVLLGVIPQLTETEGGLLIKKTCDNFGRAQLDIEQPDDEAVDCDTYGGATARFLLTASNPLSNANDLACGLVAKGRTSRDQDVAEGMGVVWCVACDGVSWRSPSLPNMLAPPRTNQQQNKQLRHLFGAESSGVRWEPGEAKTHLEAYQRALTQQIAKRSDKYVVRLKHTVVTGIHRAMFETDRQKRAQLEKDRKRLERQSSRLLAELDKMTQERERIGGAFDGVRRDVAVDGQVDPRDTAIFELAEELRRSKGELATIRDELSALTTAESAGLELSHTSFDNGAGKQSAGFFSTVFPRLDLTRCALVNHSSLDDKSLKRVLTALVDLDRANQLDAVGRGRKYDALERLDGKQTYERRLGNSRVYFCDGERPARWQVLLINPSKSVAGEGLQDKEYTRLKRRLKGVWN